MEFDYYQNKNGSKKLWTTGLVILLFLAYGIVHPLFVGEELLANGPTGAKQPLTALSGCSVSPHPPSPVGNQKSISNAQFQNLMSTIDMCKNMISSTKSQLSSVPQRSSPTSSSVPTLSSAPPSPLPPSGVSGPMTGLAKGARQGVGRKHAKASGDQKGSKNLEEDGGRKGGKNLQTDRNRKESKVQKVV